jgi:hypothetical protein
MADVDAPPLPPPVTTRPYFDGKPFASIFKKVRKLRDELAPKLNTAAQAFFGNPAINLAHAHPTTDPTLIQGPVRRITAYVGDLPVPDRLARPNAQMTGTFVRFFDPVHPNWDSLSVFRRLREDVLPINDVELVFTCIIPQYVDEHGPVRVSYRWEEVALFPITHAARLAFEEALNQLRHDLNFDITNTVRSFVPGSMHMDLPPPPPINGGGTAARRRRRLVSTRRAPTRRLRRV